MFDPFCGCATTLEAAHNLNRKWTGVDIAIHAVKRVAAIRLRDRLGLKEGADFIIAGIPHTLEGARDLWQRDPYHFQKLAVEQVDGFVTTRRPGDGGIDGRLYFALPNTPTLQSVNGGERSPLFGTIRCPIFCALRETHPGGYPAAALPSSSVAGALSMPALRLLLSR